MSDFLLELLSEEIPAWMQEKACADLARLFGEAIGKAGLAALAIETHATPRRLALIARGLPEATEAASEEIKGPRASAPPQALEGFLRKTGLTREQLVEREGVLFALVEQPGRSTGAVLAEAIPAIVRAFSWPKSMRWGDGNLRWVRPLQGIVALLGDDVVDFEIDGIRSGAATLGHRFHHPGMITIGNADDYAAKLRACHVILDPAERQAIIRDGAAALAAEAGLSVVSDEGLVAENAGLTEWPVPLLGHFDPAFLEVPREVIQLTMRTNQKYFALTAADGALAPNFICTANIEAVDGGAAIAAGNARVLSARLSDARFFWEQDLKVKLAEQAKKLDQIVFHEKLGTVADKVERVAKLARWLVAEGIVKPSPPVGEGLGEGPTKSLSAADAAGPSSQPSPTRGEGVSLADMAGQAARLCKADLVTAMVGEFPELQGVMGGYYARAEGYPDEVADAIRDHYKPVGQGDDVPTAPVTVAVSLADKLDTIDQFFSIDAAPSSSKDPFALRRAAIGAIAMLKANGLRMNLVLVAVQNLMRHQPLDIFRAKQDRRAATLNAVLDELGIEAAIGTLKAWAPTIQPDSTRREISDAVWQTMLQALPVAAAVRDFFVDRLEIAERDGGVRSDLIRASRVIEFTGGREDDLVRLLARVKALQAFVTTDDGANLLVGYRRAANILKKEGSPSPLRGEGRGEGAVPEGATSDSPSPNPLPGGERAFTLSYTPEKEEADLLAALDLAEPRAAAAVAAEDFAGAMAALAGLRAPIDRFFDKVTVNDADADKRTARLGMLARIRDAVHRVADFSKIEG